MTTSGPVTILAVVSATDRATVEAVQDDTIRRYSVICSKHGRPYSFYYTPAHTEADHEKFHDDIVLAAAKHAASYHTPRADREGNPS